MYCFEGILARKQFCSKSQAGVCVKLFQRFKVNSSLPVLNVLNTGRFLSAILVSSNFWCAAMFIFAKLDGKL